MYRNDKTNPQTEVAEHSLGICNIGYVKSTFESIGNLSDSMYNSLTYAYGGIALSIRGFTDAMQGKSDPANVVIAEQHVKYIKSLDSKQYETLLTYAVDIFPNLEYDRKKKETLSIFSGNLKS